MSTIGRNRAKDRRSPLIEYLARWERDIATRASASFPDPKADQLQADEYTISEIELGIGQFAGRRCRDRSG